VDEVQRPCRGCLAWVRAGRDRGADTEIHESDTDPLAQEKRFFSDLREAEGGRTGAAATLGTKHQDGRRATVAQEHPITRLGGWAGDEVVEDWQER